MSVRAKTITLKGPRRPGERLPDVELNVVEAVEPSPPEDEEAIRWVLITSLPINELHEIRRIIELYKKRWQVEVLFKRSSQVCGSKAEIRIAIRITNNCGVDVHRSVPSRRAENGSQRSCRKLLAVNTSGGLNGSLYTWSEKDTQVAGQAADDG
ncbi:MAG: hypothetical protein U0892_08710 [Pirellulales bacterium]